MSTKISLRPIQTGSGQYLTDHHNRPGECVINMMMLDGCETPQAAEEAIGDALLQSRAPYGALGVEIDDLATCGKWCAAEWQAAQVDMPDAQDRDGGTCDDDDARYIECHILATWPADADVEE